MPDSGLSPALKRIMRHWWPPEWDEKGVKEQIWREQLTQDFRDWFIEIGVLEQEDGEDT